MNSKYSGSGALSELRDLIQEYKNLENDFGGGEEQEEEDEDNEPKAKEDEKKKS